LGVSRRAWRLPSEEELKRVKEELYTFEIIKRSMERAGAMIE